jgi:FlaA1/EpsC-like NDP-sugar epimerase
VRRHREAGRPPTPALVIGAGASGQALVRALRAEPAGLTPVGFLDDDGCLHRVCGLPVLGRTDELAEAAGRTGARVALLAIPTLPQARLARLAERAWANGLAVRYLPSAGRTDRAGQAGRTVRVEELRDLRLSRLMGRDEVAVAGGRARHLIADRRVLVTGAGGSIGSALCRQVKRLNPAALVLLDRDADGLDRVRQEVTGPGRLNGEQVTVARADVRNRRHIEELFDQARPEFVFHAAQHLCLPSSERRPCDAVRTNVLGTRHVVDATVRQKAERLVLVSTDKAADPSSVLGATKRLSELVLQTAAGGPTCFAAVRCGNVFGSPGSLLSLLADRIESNEAVTITHPEVSRHFMTAEEAAGLVLEAAALSEEAETFVLDMGAPVPVVDLVYRCAEQLRLPDVTIRFSGLGPGEKMAEKVFADGERRIRTAHPKIWATRPAPLPAGLAQLLELLYLAAGSGDDAEVRILLRRLLPEYHPLRRPEPAAAEPTADGSGSRLPQLPGL